MASIYNINGWDSSGNTKYSVNDIVTHNGKFYYCIQYHEDKREPSVGSVYWGGTTTATAGEEPHFIWAPSYSANIRQQPKVISVQFGGGYEQRLKEGINSGLISIELKFEARSLIETTAIVHFLTDKEGYRGFWFMTPPPIGVLKKFVCEDWTTAQTFDDNYTISSTLKEIP